MNAINILILYLINNKYIKIIYMIIVRIISMIKSMKVIPIIKFKTIMILIHKDN
jgi:hypothetical protein